MNLRKLLSSFGLLMLLLCTLELSAQTRVVTGRVLDAGGKPVVGASVTVRGETVGTTTAEDGTYSLNVPTGATALIISSVGFGTQEVSIPASNVASVTLTSTAGDLNEVVVIGYGTARRRDVTGSVAVVTAKDFVKGPIISPENLIAGKVAGVQITPNGGAPGAGSTVRIRGGSSLNASNDPLYVIDGVPVDGGVAGMANPLSAINPNDIESFVILKDPSSAAIYGSRASNGVILITTKKGRPGAVRFNVMSNTFVQTPTQKVDVLTADQIRDIVATKGAAGDVSKLGTANTDWQDEIFQTAIGQDLNLSASGAGFNGKLPFRISGNYLNQNGILREGKFERQALGFNLSPKFLNDALSIDFNFKGIRTASKFADEGAIGAAINFDPTQPVRVNSNRFGGFFEYLETINIGVVPKDLSPRNPVALLENRDSRSSTYRALGNIAFNYKIPFVKGLAANLNLGADIQRGSGTVVVSDSAASTYRRYEIVRNAANTRDSVARYGGVNNEYKSENKNKLLDFYLNYNKALGNSNLEVTAGYGYQDFSFTNYAFPDRRFSGWFPANSIPAANQDTVTTGYTLISYYGRLNYSIANKYVFTFNARTDGVSKYNPADRWGFFPSAAFAWRINNEDFMKGNQTISDLKLRLGYGKTGQQAGIGFYEFISRYGVSNAAANYQLGNEFYTMARPAGYDPFLRWETSTNYNVGVDFGFWQNRLQGSIDVFYRETEDLLNVIPVPVGTNFTNRLRQNVGNMESKGLELNLNAGLIRKRDFTLDVNFNFTYVKPEITKLLANDDPNFKGNRVGGIAGGTGNQVQINAIGGRPNAFYVYKQVYDANGAPIEGLYEDLNRDGLINDEDLYAYKSPDPNFFAGFSAQIGYRKWSAGFVMRANFENYVYNNVASNLGVKNGIISPLGFLSNASSDYLVTNFENNQYFSDYYVQNASFLKMDNFNIGYNAGTIFRGASLGVSFNIQNVFVVTKYKGIDPEIGGGIDNQFYPRPRTYTLGLNLNF